MLSAPRSVLRSACLAFVLLLTGVAAIAATTIAKPPPTRVEAVRDTLHGSVVEDPYRWLENKDAPETRAWIDAQNAYTDAVLAPVQGKERIQARLEQLLKNDTQSVPFERGGRYFFTRRRADQQLAVMYMRNGIDGKDEVLIDPHGLSADHTTSVGFSNLSLDGSLMAYLTRVGGEDEVTISFMEVESRRTLADRLPRARYYGVVINADKNTVYYAKQTAEGPRVYSHAMGSDPATDRMLFGEGYGKEKIIGVSMSSDRRWLQISVYYGSGTDRSEIYVQNVAAGGPLVPLVNDIPAYFVGGIAGNTMVMKTNWEAEKGRILAVDLEKPARENWKEIVPAGETVIDDFSLVGGRLVVQYLKNVSSDLRVFDLSGKALGTIELPAIGTAGSVGGLWTSNEAFFNFASYHQPSTIYRYDIATGKKTVWWRSAIPIRSEQFEVKQVWYPSKDGTKIPMFLVHRKGLKLDGSNPTLLTGYGGFNVSSTPGFSSRAALWVESGGVYAVPSLRGGGEFGEAWHKAGMLAKKQNVFDDFIAAAEWLIANKYTRTDRLSISGGSNGGLLVGAALTQRPELFGAVVCSVPLLDMLRYQNFLVARFWVPEYGTAENPEHFRFLSAYSPYQNVKKGVKYPAVLFITGDSDTRVDPLHARKMCALLQASTGSDNPVLLHYDTKAGHSSGGKPVKKQIEDLTDELVFLGWQLGVTLAPGSGPTAEKASSD